MSKTDIKETADFRQSTGACARAISKDASVSLNFDDDATDVDVESQALPEIPVNATVEEKIRIRGRSDAIALHRQYHDSKLHSKYAYTNTTSNLCFAMAEQARVELLGARALHGVGANLNAVLGQRYQLLNDAMRSSKAASNLDSEKLGVEHAISLYLREQIGGELPPSCREALTDWREWLDNEVAPSLQEGQFPIEDQQAFASAFQELLQKLDIETETGDAPDTNENADTDEEEGEESESDDNQGGGDQDSEAPMQDDGGSEVADDDSLTDGGSDALEPDGLMKLFDRWISAMTMSLIVCVKRLISTLGIYKNR